MYVAGDSDILLSRSSRGREAVFGPSIYEYRFENGKVREKIAFFQKYFCRLHGSCVFCYNTIKKDLQQAAGISPALIAKLGRNENVSTESLVKICTALHCDIGDIMEIVLAEGGESCDSQ